MDALCVLLKERGVGTIATVGEVISRLNDAIVID